MRQILIDELNSDDMEKLNNFLAENVTPASIEGVYWVELPTDLLDPGQFEEKDEHPFCFAIEVGDTWAKFELLIRSHVNMQSQHIRYANSAQQKHIYDFVNKMISDLELRT